MAEAAATAHDRHGVIDPGGRKAIRTAAKIVAAVVLLELVGLATWWYDSTWRLGRIELINDGPPLTVQVLGADSDEPIGEPVELVIRATLALPDGDYRLRVTGWGRLGRIDRVAVNRGETIAHPITLDDGRMLGEAPAAPMPGQGPPRKEPIAYAPDTAAIELTPHKADLIEWTNNRLSRRDGATGQVTWDALSPTPPGKPPRAVHPWVPWLAARSQQAGVLINPAPDIDGDGTGDLVWAVSAGAGFLALSGKDGSVLWTYLAELDGPGGAYPEGPDLPGPIHPAVRPSWVIGQPAVGDLDRDGVPDLLATISFQEFPAEAAKRSPSQPQSAFINTQNLARRVVQAISGRTGKPLWSHAIDPAFAPFTNQWNWPAAILPGRRGPTLGILVGPSWRGLDPATGRPNAGPIDLGFEPVRSPQYADLDGDGEADLIAAGPGTGPSRHSLAAFSIAAGRPLWTAGVNAGLQAPFGMTESPAWPVVADLDGDGRAEIVVPDSGALDPANNYHGVRMIDGATGRTRWIRPICPATIGQDGLAGVYEAPDLDRDGCRDLVAASIFLGRTPTNFHQGRRGRAREGLRRGPLGQGRPAALVVACQRRDGPDHEPGAAPVVGPGPGRLAAPGPPAQRPEPSDGGAQGKRPSDPSPPVVTMLEASTGREVQTLPGINEVHAADLDGDGLMDLWGDDQGELRAFRGEGPEAWRALGGFYPAQGPRYLQSEPFRPAADFDGDSIGDTLIAPVQAPREAPTLASSLIAQGSRTAVARSGRDGRAIWRTRLDVRRGWLDRDLYESYGLTSFPLPHGDLDGDGTPDVLVQEQAQTQQLPIQAIRGPATLPLLLLSGRTGRPLWAVGPLPIEFEAHGYSQVQWMEPRIVEPGAPPDLLVRHNSPFLAASATPPPPNAASRPHLARVSGRTGRILWDIPLEDRPLNQPFGYAPPPELHDLDGDAILDAAMTTQGPPGPTGQPTFELRAISLRGGRPLWSRPFTNEAFHFAPYFEIFDPGAGKPPVLVGVFEDSSPGNLVLSVRAFDGRDGRPLWTWDDREHPTDRPSNPWLISARQETGRSARLCVNYVERGGKRRIVVLDLDGREVARRDLPGGSPIQVSAADCDGDGPDELLVWYADRLRAWGLDLEERWSWPDKFATSGQVIPVSAGRPPEVIVTPGLGLDGATGRPRWKGQGDLVWPFQAPQILDPGNSTNLPLQLVHRQGETICRRTMPAAPDGTFAMPRGEPVPPGLPREDPRWTRLLPWIEPVVYRLGLKGFAALAGLAVVNVMVPLAILRLASRRRVWSVRALMAMPVAAAVPLWVFQAVEPLIPAQVGTTPVSPRIVFALATVAGLPIVLYAATAGWMLVRGRWKPLARMAALTALASAITAAAWLWADSRAMPAIEHYGRTGWYLVIVPGAYAAGVLVLIAWPIRRAYRWLRRPRRPTTPTP